MSSIEIREYIEEGPETPSLRYKRLFHGSTIVTVPTALAAEIEHLQRESVTGARAMRLLEDLSAAGSESVGNPERCAENIRRSLGHAPRLASERNKLRNALEIAETALRAHEAWEADIILNADWSHSTPRLTQEQCDALPAVQRARNDALTAIAAAKAGKSDEDKGA